MVEKVKKPINILSIENGNGPGGAFKCTLNIAGGLNRDLFKSHVFIPADWALYEKLPSDIKITAVKQCIFRNIDSNFKFIINFLFGVIPFITNTFICCKKNNIKMIVLNNDMYSNYGGILAASLLKIPCVLHCRGLTYNSPFMKFLSKRVNLFLAVSGFIKLDYKKLGIEDRKIQVLFDGDDPERYDPEIDASKETKEFAVSPGTFNIGSIAMLAEWKGQDVLLKAAKEVLKEIPNCRFFIIGDSASKDTKYKEGLISLAKNLNINDKVVFTGYRSDIPQMFKILDVVIHSPIKPDPLPGVIIQAAAMKKPIIASNCGGIPEMIKDGESGILFEPGNVEELKNAIIDLLKNKEKREALAENARKTFLREFTLDVIIKKVEQAYETVLP